MPVTALRPTAETVAMDWLTTVDGVPTGKVNTTRPALQDRAGTRPWLDSGFVTIQTVDTVFDEEAGMRRSRVQVDCWAYRLDAAQAVKPDKRLASQIAQAVADACQVRADRQAREVTRNGYAAARVYTAAVDLGPRDLTGLDGVARWSLDVALYWSTTDTL